MYSLSSNTYSKGTSLHLPVIYFEFSEWKASSNSRWACLCSHSIYIHAKDMDLFLLERSARKRLQILADPICVHLVLISIVKAWIYFSPKGQYENKFEFLLSLCIQFTLISLVGALNRLMPLRKVCMQIYKISSIFRYNMACYWHATLVESTLINSLSHNYHTTLVIVPI